MFMDATKKITALFDCDGVIVDTEGQYTVFWNEMGQKYVNDETLVLRLRARHWYRFMINTLRENRKNSGISPRH